MNKAVSILGDSVLKFGSALLLRDHCFLANTVQLLCFSGVYNSGDLVLEVGDQCCHWWTVCGSLRSTHVLSWGVDVQDAEESAGKY